MTGIRIERLGDDERRGSGRPVYDPSPRMIHQPAPIDFGVQPG